MARVWTPSLIALALAAALSVAPPPALAQAQQLHTSQGLRTLPRTDGFTTEAQFRQAERLAENVTYELLQDIAAAESSRGAVVEQAGGLADSVKRENAEYDRAKATFDQRDQKYRSDLASYEQRRTALESDTQRQRTQAAALQALPSAQRDYSEVTRLNAWADQLGQQRSALDSERVRLVDDQADIEVERGKLAKQRSDAESRLKGSRDAAVSEYGTVEQRRAEAYRQLRVATNYLRAMREEIAKRASGPIGHSQALDEANAKLAAYEARAARH